MFTTLLCGKAFSFNLPFSTLPRVVFKVFPAHKSENKPYLLCAACRGPGRWRINIWGTPMIAQRSDLCLVHRHCPNATLCSWAGCTGRGFLAQKWLEIPLCLIPLCLEGTVSDAEAWWCCIATRFLSMRAVPHCPVLCSQDCPSLGVFPLQILCWIQIFASDLPRIQKRCSPESLAIFENP